MTRSRMTSTTTGTRCSTIIFFAVSSAGSDLLRVLDPQRLAAHGLRHLDVVDAVAGDHIVVAGVGVAQC